MHQVFNPFPMLSKEDGVAKLDKWSQHYDAPPYTGLVHHYTSVAALAGILESRSLFCTDYRQLNDATELGLGLEVVEAAIAARAADVGIAPDCVAEMLNRLSLLRRASFHISMFCGSFSLRRNDLTQWRAYAPRGGVSIGFREPLLKKVAESQGFVCGAVRYLGAPLFIEWLTAQLSELKRGWECMGANETQLRSSFPNEPLDHMDGAISSQRAANAERWIGEVSALLKNSDFRSEAEWRCLYVLRENTIQHRKEIGFRTTLSDVKRYVRLDLSSADLNDLVPEIVIGPGGGDMLYQLVADLCQMHSLSTSVYQPDHSFRPNGA